MLNFILLNLCPVVIKAETIADNKEYVVIHEESILYYQTTALDMIGSTSIRVSIEINGEKNYLYPIFDNKELALKNFKIVEKELLDKLQETYNLNELGEDNWKEYNSKLSSLLRDSIINIEEFSKDIVIFGTFMSYYEGDDLNEGILDYIEGKKQSDLCKDEEFLSMLPYTAPLVEEYNQELKKAKIKKSLGISLMRLDDSTVDAVAYAYQYTNHRNYDYDYFDENDCTNFVSQILENSGKSQDSTWWHYQDFMGVNYQSTAWINANAFVNHFGTVFITTSHYRFSAYLKAGDYIALDMGKNGHWNHCGFVIASDNYLTGDYYDYLVSQHSDDYIAWASSSINHWDTYDGGGNQYAVIRP